MLGLQHDIFLPLRLKGEKKAASKDAPPTTCPSLVRRVKAVGLRPRLVMSTPAVDFMDRVVSRDPSRRVPFSEELTFTNSDTTGVTWMLNDEVLSLPPMLAPQCPFLSHPCTPPPPAPPSSPREIFAHL